MNRYHIPVLGLGPVILESQDAHIRDPSGVLWFKGRYHCWPTRVDLDVGEPDGYRGKVWHFAASSLSGPWEDLGPAILPGAESEAFDGLGTFTADAIYDDALDEWFLFYTATSRSFTRERTVTGFGRTSIAIAQSDSPDGPWEKLPQNPVIVPGNNPTAWDGMRIDEAMPMVIFGERRVYMRGVQLVREEPFEIRQLPGMYVPRRRDTWAGSYCRYERCPLTRPPNQDRGFEAYAYLPGPDNLLHMISVNGWDGSPDQLGHAVSSDGLQWEHTGRLHLSNPGGYVYAIHPVWSSATPGTDAEVIGLVTQMRDTDGRLKVQALTLDWAEQKASDIPPPAHPR